MENTGEKKRSKMEIVTGDVVQFINQSKNNGTVFHVNSFHIIVHGLSNFHIIFLSRLGINKFLEFSVLILFLSF